MRFALSNRHRAASMIATAKSGGTSYRMAVTYACEAAGHRFEGHVGAPGWIKAG